MEPTAGTYRLGRHLREAARRGLWLLAAAIVAIGAFAGHGPAGHTRAAMATVPGVDQVTLSWDTANRVYYGNYNTPIFSTTGTDGRVSFAYCVDPSTTVPPAGSYATTSVEEFNPYWAPEIRAAMWFSYGGPGFDPAMWPSQWNDGTPMDAAKYYAASHLILSYATTQNMGYVYYNAGPEFIDYAASTFLGVNLYGDTVNPGSTMFQMFARANEVPDTYTCYYLECGRWDYAQYVIGQDYYEPPAPAAGSLVIEKTSANPSLSNANPCYTLAGAVFGIYADEACTQHETDVTLDASGRGSTGELAVGTHWVKERIAPPGYALDGTVHRVDVPSGETVTLSLVDNPQYALPELLVQKADAEAGPQAQGSASLAGAEFAVRYYAGIFDQNNLPASPTRSWVFATDSQGRAILDDAALVSGDEFYRNAAGKPVLPLGTISIQETKAPAGYALSDTDIRVVAVTADGMGETVTTYVAPVIEDAVERGGLRVQKADIETGQTAPQGAASMAGAVFSITTLNDAPVIVNGKTYHADEVVATLTTDEDGHATTGADALPCGTYRVQETKAPAGYLVSGESWDVTVCAGQIVDAGSQATAQETATEGGYGDGGAVVSNGAAPDTVAAQQPLAFLTGLFAPSIAHAEEAPDQTFIPEQVVRGGIRAYKVDADTGTGQPQGDATLENTEFSIVSVNDGPVLVAGTIYHKGDVVMKIYTNKDGIAETGPRDLPYGTYTVEETGAPTGYRRAAQFVVIEQDGVIVEVGKKFENDVKRGGIRIQKVDADTGMGQPQGDATLAGTRFAIANQSEHPVMVGDVQYEPGEVVMTVETGEDGIAQTGDQDLPFGTYTVTEVTPPTGYLAGNGTAQMVEITENGTVYELEATFANGVARGGISLLKQDAETETGAAQGAATLAGAEFSIVNASKEPVVVGGTAYQPGETVAVIVTDETGAAATGTQDLPYGTYTVSETKAPEGYIPTGKVQTVQVRENGVVVALPEPVGEQVARGGFGLRKLDAETGQAKPQGSATLAGARFEVVNANGQAVVVDGTAYESGQVVAVLETNADGWAQTKAHALPFGTYVVTEVAPPAGYHKGQTDETGAETGAGYSITAVVDGDMSWHSYESDIFDQVVRGGISLVKTDAELGEGQAQGAAVLSGAQFTITNSSERAVVVGGEAYGPGEVVMTLTTDAAGRAATGPRDLPFGTYTVAEAAPPAGYAPDGGAQTVTIAEEGVTAAVAQPFCNRVLRGGIELRKADAELGNTGPQGAGRYQGAVFEIINANAQPVLVGGTAYQPEEVVTSIETDAQGYAATSTDALPFGTYRVREAQPPAGYLVNETAWEATIAQNGQMVRIGIPVETVPVDEKETGGGNPVQPLFDAIASLFRPATAHAEEAPAPTDDDEKGTATVIPEQVVRGGVAVQKIDSETGGPAPQGDATLAGTAFAIASLNDNPVLVDGHIYSKGETVLIITSDEAGTARSAPDALPFGTYELREKAAPEGYLPGSEASAQTFSIVDNGQIVTVDLPFSNSPIRGGLSVRKVDADTGNGSPLADGSLARTHFAITNAGKNAVMVNGVSYEPGAVVLTLETDETGCAATGPRDLPFGTYTVIEVAAPEGYTPSGSIEQTVLIREDGVIVACEQSFANRIARGDVAGVKVEDETGTTLPGVAFLVTSLTTGERHVVVTDEEGLFSTASTHVPHTHNTNANDRALAADGTVADEHLLSSENGIWFSGTTDHAIAPDDTLGALPFDAYRFDELATSASHGHHPVTFEVAVRDDGTVIELGKVGNHLIQLHTEALLASTGMHEGPTGPDERITDTVAYTGLVPGTTYELRTELIDRDTGQSLAFAGTMQENRGSSGEKTTPAWMTTMFTPARTDGTVEVALAIDASQLAGTRATVLERLYLDGKEIASHADVADDDQTVTFVDIATTALGATSRAHQEQATSAAIIVDAVTYVGLTPGVTYTVEGVLMNRATREPLRDKHGDRVTAHTTFTPAMASGTVDVTFELDATGLAGTTVVAFETLMRDNVAIASHMDLDDNLQAVSFIDIKTCARDKATGAHTGEASGTTVIVDAITYQGLTPGEEYLLEGLLIEQESGEVLTDLSGTAVASSVAFIPEAPEGTVEIEFAFDASEMEGMSAVVFENLLHGESIVASHADLTDADQTVSWPTPRIPITGDSRSVAMAALLFGGAAAALTGGTFLIIQRRRRRRRRTAPMC